MKIAVCIFILLLIIYFSCIMPRILQRPEFIAPNQKLYAHRGLYDNAAEAPENSMAAFKKAVEAGYGIELDVHLSKDRIPVVFHDFTLQRVCGAEGKISEFTYAQLQEFSLYNSSERIPKLAEVLELVRGQVPLIIEYKVEYMNTAVCYEANQMLKDYKGPYCVESFHPLVLLWYRKYCNHVVRGQLSDSFRKESKLRGFHYMVVEYLLVNFITKPDFIAYNHKYYKNISRKLCKKFYGAVAAAWTIRSQEELEARKRDFDIFIFDSFCPEEGTI